MRSVESLHYPRIVRRHQWPPSRIRTFLTDLASIAISTPGNFHLEVITECPADNCYLECAIEGTAVPCAALYLIASFIE
jgi:hypothetical protein